MTDGAPAWIPDEATRARARLTEFIHFTGTRDYDEMYRRSVTEVPWFTEQVLRFLQIPFDRPYSKVVDLSRGIEWPRWCVDGGLNITRVLDRHAAERPDQLGLIAETEDGQTTTLTWRELRDQVARAAGGLKALGLRKGDPIGIHLPMIAETAIALLAIGRIGAIAVPLFSGYGPQAIETRLNDVGAKALFATEGFQRRGRPVPALDASTEALKRCPTVRHVIKMPGDWAGLLAHEPVAAERTLAEDPLLIVYTSGTTGRPKGIAHTHCGFPVKAAQDMAFGCDVGPNDRILWVTDIGWMMGPWLIYGSVILGATMALYDGAPDFPHPARIWSLVARHRLTVLGISPTLVRAQMAADAVPRAEDDISSLRILSSTGEPWNPDPWLWLFEKVGRKKIPLMNYSGGTECSGGILMSNPLFPIKPCSFSAPCPGIAADVLDEHGESVRGTGEVGELVIRQPWIGQARGFWKDPERYLETYWRRWPGTWVHGDWARVDADGQWYITGRSDDTLKVAGKRVGPAEVESVLVSHPDVAEAAVIGIPDERQGMAMIAFCVVGANPSADLAAQLTDLVGRELGKPLRPSKVHFIGSLPKTRNAKVMRRIIRAAYLDEPTGDVTALENPASLQAITEAKGEQ